jgi:hypothetical protein
MVRKWQWVPSPMPVHGAGRTVLAAYFLKEGLQQEDIKAWTCSTQTQEKIE